MISRSRQSLSALALGVLPVTFAFLFAAKPAVAVPIGWHVTFDIEDTPVEHVDLTFSTADTKTQSSINPTFYGYKVDYTTLSGTQSGVPVKGLDVNTDGFSPSNDNLFSSSIPPVSNPTTPFFSLGGLAYQETGPSGEIYAIFQDANNNLMGNCSSGCTLSVRNFQVSVTPEPGTAALLATFGLFGATLVRCRRRK